MSNPLLSIGIIFKDDIRCIERCLKALTPLRGAFPCELVMADTGSTDGSREIAEKYADIVIDFPWINDFAAARNAVMDRCSGAWFLSVDTDEYLNTGVKALENFLTMAEQPEEFATVMIRNHDSYEMDGDYTDFMALRMARMSEHPRFVGSIHETLSSNNLDYAVRAFPQVIFDHDGYVGMDSTEAGKAKRQRNLKLLRKRIAEEPKALAIQLEMLDSAVEEPDFPELVRNAVNVVREKPEGWDRIGPSVLRNAIYAADVKKLPERDEWIEMAENWFPNSLFTRVDVQFAKLAISFREKEYEKCISFGEAYLEAMADYYVGIQVAELMYGILSQAAPMQVQRAKIILADACCNSGRLERTMELLAEVDYTKLSQPLVAELMSTLQELHYKSDLNTAPLIQAVWEGISQDKPNKEKAALRKEMFFNVAGTSFAPQNQEKERKRKDFRRSAYTLYLPLLGKCEIGSAAAVLEENNPKRQEELLASVENWPQFPIHALREAIERGARFPVPGSSLDIEVMDSLASRLAADQKRFLPLVKRITEDFDRENVQNLVWARGIALAGMQTFSWVRPGYEKPTEEKIAAPEAIEQQRVEDGLMLARAFARTEKAFLPLCYAPSALTADNLFLLPPMHRFGWYCARAFDALEQGDTAGYVRQLREGLAVCENMKDMVEFLLDHTPETQVPAPSAELRALADQIRAVLANFAPDDPSVLALKQSEAYQKVAYLIEGAAVPVQGGLVQ